MDLTESIQPRSDQINADDLIAGPMTVTVREVVKGAAEQPFDFKLVETDRAYRPSKTMRRVIVNAWGPEAAMYAGRRLTLYREPSIMFGGQKVGGIRISHMSHITGTVELMAQTTRGKREKFTVQPLAAPTAAEPDLDYEPVTMPSVGKQLSTLGAMERADLYRLCGVVSKLTPADAHALFTAKAHELGLPHSDPPSIHAILSRARIVARQNLPSDAADEFQRGADTGEWLDNGDQATITELDAEAHV